VLRVLKEHGAKVLFATHKEWGHESIQPMLDSVGLDWKPMAAARPLRRAMGIRDLVLVARDLIVGWWELIQMIRHFRPTHIHVPNEYQSVYNIPVLAASGVPIVYRLGDAPVETPWFLRELWSRLVVPNVSRFVCVSEYIRGRLLDTGAAPEKVDVIYSYPPARLADRTLVGVPPFEGRTGLYIGQIAEHKGVDLLVESAIEICRARDDVRFLIAGDYTWQNSFAEALIERVESLGLSDRIQFLGFVEDVPGLLAATDIHMCPSVWEEPLSNTVVEAKRSGVPSIVFSSGGLPELIEHEVDGWICDAKTAESLKYALDRMLALPDSALHTMAEEAQASMERLGITKAAFTDAWVEVYQQAAKAGH
jgi:glycosyltransferase involved in cell wall biosynthesis